MRILFPFALSSSLFVAFFSYTILQASESSDDEEVPATPQNTQHEPKWAKELRERYEKHVLDPQGYKATELLEMATSFFAPSSAPSTDAPKTTSTASGSLAVRTEIGNDIKDSTLSGNKNLDMGQKNHGKKALSQLLYKDGIEKLAQCKEEIVAEQAGRRKEFEDLKKACDPILHACNDALNHVSSVLEILKGNEALDWVKQQLDASEQNISSPLLQLHRFMIQFDLEHTYGLLAYVRANLFPHNTPSSINRQRLELTKSFIRSGTSLEKYGKENVLYGPDLSDARQNLKNGLRLLPLSPSYKDFVIDPPKRARPQRLYAYYTHLHDLMQQILGSIESLPGSKELTDGMTHHMQGQLASEYGGSVLNAFSDPTKIANLIKNTVTDWSAENQKKSLRAKCDTLFNQTMGVSAKDSKKASNKNRTNNPVERLFSRTDLLNDPNWEFLQNLKFAAEQYETLQQKLLSLSPTLEKIESNTAFDESAMLALVQDLKTAARAVEFFDFKAPARRVVWRSRNLVFYEFLDSLTSLLRAPTPPKNSIPEAAGVTTFPQPIVLPESTENQQSMNTTGSNNNNSIDNSLSQQIIDPYDSDDPLQLHAFHQERKKALRNQREAEASATAASLTAAEKTEQAYRESFHNFLQTIHLTRLKMHQFEEEIKERGFTLEITQTGNGSQCRVFPDPKNSIFGQDAYYKNAYFTFHIVHGSKDSVLPHEYLKQIRNGFASVFGLYER